MNDHTTNQLDMVGTCLNVADKPENFAVWNGQPPLDYGTDLSGIRGEYQAIRGLAVLADAATTGPADAKASAETTLENTAFLLARACVSHFRKTGNMTDLAKVDFKKGGIQKLRDQALVTTGTFIRDLAQTASAQPGAAGRGVNAARITALTNAVNGFSALLNAPRGQIASRSALKREVATRVAGLLGLVEAIDDLVVQFDTTPAGRTFIAAWKQARIIVDGGHGPGEDDEGGGTPPPAPNP